MGEETWRPLDVLDGDDLQEYDALVDGVPEWLWSSFWLVIQGLICKQESPNVLNQGMLLAYERVCRIQLGTLPYSADEGVGLLMQRVGPDEHECLVLLDFLLANARNPPLSAIDRVLRESGSAWTVGTRSGQPALVRRVPAGVQTAADAAMRTPGQAGADLRRAWEAIYGVKPNPTVAYSLAVRAVEHAAVQVVVPKQNGATLGHVRGKMKTDGDWRLALTREPAGLTPPEGGLPLAVVSALWEGQHDRHGGEPSAPGNVSQAEAEAAVSLAVSLVHWFASGLVQRRP